MSDSPPQANKKRKERTRSMKELFIEYAKAHANLDESGYSDTVLVEDLQKSYPDRNWILSNGRSWCRDDGPLGKEYIIGPIRSGNSTVGIRLQGFNRNPAQRTISNEIKKQIKSQRCAVLATGKPQVDHKDGRYETRDNDQTATQKIEDFQPLSRHANTAKRQHCKECKAGGGWNRFDATRLGYSAPYLYGDAQTKNCQGCYWHDPKLFNRTISKDYKKTK